MDFVGKYGLGGEIRCRLFSLAAYGEIKVFTLGKFNRVGESYDGRKASAAGIFNWLRRLKVLEL